MTLKHEKHLQAMGMMPILLIQKYFFNKALHLVSVLGPKPAGCNTDFAGNLGDKAASKCAFLKMTLPGPWAAGMRQH